MVLQFIEDNHFTKMSIKMECHEVSILLPNGWATFTDAWTKQIWHNVNKGSVKMAVHRWSLYSSSCYSIFLKFFILTSWGRRENIDFVA